MGRTLESVVKILNEKGYPTTQDGVVTYLEKQYPMRAIIVPLIEGPWNFDIEHVANEVIKSMISYHEFRQSSTN